MFPTGTIRASSVQQQRTRNPLSVPPTENVPMATTLTNPGRNGTGTGTSRGNSKRKGKVKASKGNDSIRSSILTEAARPKTLSQSRRASSRSNRRPPTCEEDELDEDIPRSDAKKAGLEGDACAARASLDGDESTSCGAASTSWGSASGSSSSFGNRASLSATSTRRDSRGSFGSPEARRCLLSDFHDKENGGPTLNALHTFSESSKSAGSASAAGTASVTRRRAQRSRRRSLACAPAEDGGHGGGGGMISCRPAKKNGNDRKSRLSDTGILGQLGQLSINDDSQHESEEEGDKSIRGSTSDSSEASGTSGESTPTPMGSEEESSSFEEDSEDDEEDAGVVYLAENQFSDDDYEPPETDDDDESSFEHETETEDDEASMHRKGGYCSTSDVSDEESSDDGCDDRNDGIIQLRGDSAHSDRRSDQQVTPKCVPLRPIALNVEDSDDDTTVTNYSTDGDHVLNVSLVGEAGSTVTAKTALLSPQTNGARARIDDEPERESSSKLSGRGNDEQNEVGGSQDVPAICIDQGPTHRRLESKSALSARSGATGTTATTEAAEYERPSGVTGSTACGNMNMEGVVSLPVSDDAAESNASKRTVHSYTKSSSNSSTATGSTALSVNHLSSLEAKSSVASAATTSTKVARRRIRPKVSHPHAPKFKWKLGSLIGSGSFGTVHLGINKSKGTLMAVKSMCMSSTPTADGPNVGNEEALAEFQREIDVMSQLSHPNIVRYLGADILNTESKRNSRSISSYYDGNSKGMTVATTLYIFQEWVPGGSLTGLLRKFGPLSASVIQSYLKQILLGLQYLHRHHIIHRDIKGGNILVDDRGCVKLADFGASKQLYVVQEKRDGEMQEPSSNEDGEKDSSFMCMTATLRGTPYFMAPEVYMEKYNNMCDIWSVGGVIYQMATGEPPWKVFGYKNPMALFWHLKNTTGPPPPFSTNVKPTASDSGKVESNKSGQSLAGVSLNDYPPSLHNIIAKCFHRDPKNRSSAQELLRHSFFKESWDSDDETDASPLSCKSRVTSRTVDEGEHASGNRESTNRAMKGVRPSSTASFATLKQGNATNSGTEVLSSLRQNKKKLNRLTKDNPNPSCNGSTSHNIQPVQRGTYAKGLAPASLPQSRAKQRILKEDVPASLKDDTVAYADVPSFIDPSHEAIDVEGIISPLSNSSSDPSCLSACISNTDTESSRKAMISDAWPTWAKRKFVKPNDIPPSTSSNVEICMSPIGQSSKQRDPNPFGRGKRGSETTTTTSA